MLRIQKDDRARRCFYGVAFSICRTLKETDFDDDKLTVLMEMLRIQGLIVEVD